MHGQCDRATQGQIPAPAALAAAVPASAPAAARRRAACAAGGGRGDADPARGAAVAFGVFAALRFYLVTWLGERVVADLRQAVYRRVVRMDPSFFEVTKTGEVLSRLTADTTLVQAIAGVNLSITLRSILNVIGALVMLALTSSKLMAVILVLIPLVIGPLIIVGRRVRR